MPRYHALEASVSLSVWAPGPEFADVSSAPLMTSQARIKNRRNKPANPANGQPVVVLDEDAFVGQEGVSFLGPAMPFFLVDSGKNLFQDTPATNSNRSLNDRFRSSGQPTPTTSAPSRHLRQSSRSLRSASRAPSNGTPEPGLSLKQSPQKVSRISTTCMREKSLVPNPDGNQEPILVGSPLPLVPPFRVLLPLSTAVPMKVDVDLTRCSFMKSVLSDKVEEICVNIFYNGELTHSRIQYKASQPVSHREHVSIHFAGHRLDTYSEVPWLVAPQARTSDGLSRGNKGKDKACGLEDVWNNVNSLISSEADKWGRYGKFRTPMSEYLNSLSKIPVPIPTEGLKDANGRPGIIDVVITLGRTVGVNLLSKPIRAPRRNLPKAVLKDQVVEVPEEARTNNQAWLVKMPRARGEKVNTGFSQNSTIEVDASAAQPVNVGPAVRTLRNPHPHRHSPRTTNSLHGHMSNCDEMWARMTVNRLSTTSARLPNKPDSSSSLASARAPCLRHEAPHGPPPSSNPSDISSPAPDSSTRHPRRLSNRTKNVHLPGRRDIPCAIAERHSSTPIPAKHLGRLSNTVASSSSPATDTTAADGSSSEMDVVSALNSEMDFDQSFEEQLSTPPHRTTTAMDIDVDDDDEQGTFPSSECPHSPSHFWLPNSSDEDPAQPEGPWKPNNICKNSVLTYADNDTLPGVEYEQKQGAFCRAVRAEREGVFKTSGILMGVRFVVGL